MSQNDGVVKLPNTLTSEERMWWHCCLQWKYEAAVVEYLQRHKLCRIQQCKTFQAAYSNVKKTDWFLPRVNAEHDQRHEDDVPAAV
jgi:hypothetical protein